MRKNTIMPPLVRSSNIQKNLRSFISEVEEAGALFRITNDVNWKFEIGEMTRAVGNSSKGSHALLFENVKDYPGWCVFTNGLGTYTRIAIALGVSMPNSDRGLVEVIKQRIANPFKPEVSHVRQSVYNVHLEKEVNLFRLPVPWWHKEDGGRYIGTWHLNITKDPETGQRNVGIYRMELLDKKTTTVSFSPKSHIGVHFNKAEKINKPLEMAVAIGVPEVCIIAAAAAPPYGVDEFALAGGLNAGPVKLTKCRTVNLEVPASSEIVLEGRILPNIRVKDGPFLDYSGVPNTNPNACQFEVQCLMYKDNPVFRGAAIGYPGAEDHLLLSLLAYSGCLDFHGSTTRQKVQNMLLKHRMFRCFQLIGRLRQHIEKLWR